MSDERVDSKRQELRHMIGDLTRFASVGTSVVAVVIGLAALAAVIVAIVLF
jgi:hypothetical protein